MADLARAGARGALVTLSSQGARFVLRFGSMVVLARLLTPEDFGLVAMATTVVGIAEIIRDFGLSSAAIQSRTLSDAERSNLFWINVGIGGACCGVAAACSGLIAGIYGDGRVQLIVLALCWLMLVSGANTQFRAELSRSLRFRALAVTDVAAQVLSVAVAIGAAALGAGFWAIVFQQVTLVIATCVCNVAQCGWRPGWYRRDTSVTRFMKYGGGVVGTQLIGYATNNVDNLAIGAVWGAAPLGLYSRAYQLLLVPLEQINRAMTSVVLPVLSKVRDDAETFGRYVSRVQLVNSYLLGVGFAVSAGLASPLVDIIFGPGWTAITPIFAVLAIGGAFRAQTQVIYWVFLALGRTGEQLRLYLVTRPVMIALMLGGLPWGPVGVAVGHSVAFFGYWLVSLWWVGRSGEIRVAPLLYQALGALLFVALPAGLFAWAGASIADGPAASLLIGLTASVGYIAAISLMSRTQRRDVQAIGRLVRRAMSRSR